MEFNGPAIVPGRPDASLLLEAIRYDDTAYVQMPPDEKLPNHVVADFEDWVRKRRPVASGVSMASGSG